MAEITAKQNDFVVLTKWGLYDSGDSDGCLGSLLLFSEIGLEPLDYDEKVRILSKAIIEELKNLVQDEYYTETQYNYGSGIHIYIRKKIEINQTPLNKW